MDPARTQWKFELLGVMRGRRGDLVLDRFQTRKTAALLAYLAYFPGRRRTREELADLLWPDADMDAGRNRLSQAVGWLRGQLEPEGTPRGAVLLADRRTIGIDPLAVATDVAEFEAALADAQKAPEADQTAALGRAVDRYHGDLLPGYYDEWVLAERQRLLELYLPALRRLMSRHEQRREWDRALEYARRALAADPLAEELHLDLIRLLAASGQTAAALRQGREMERLIAKELGEEPSPAAREAVARIRRNVVPPPPSPPAKRGGGLPAQMTRFFGRESEIARVRELIESGGARLVTLAGMGGAGKTRLAIEIAARLRAHFADAVFFVPLADLSDARLIPGALADLLAPAAGGDVPPMERVAAALSARPSLLVVDNLEHLIDDAVPLIRDLLERAPSLTVLVTSRQRLNLDGEREIDVPPLAAPTGELEAALPDAARDRLMRIDSVRLFVDRAQSVRPSFALTPQYAADVARLCARLDGLPLAIELCASWARTLTPTQMLAHLTRRFDLLVSRRADITPRHRTLRATLEYSYLLLPAHLQGFFIRLSVFRGGWTLESAAAVCLDGDAERAPISSLEAITELRERSLVVTEEAAEEMRYRMLETLREFAAEQRTLSVEEPLQRRHAAFFLTLAEQAEPHMTSPNRTAWLTRLEADHDNLRAALEWMIERGEREDGLRMAVALYKFWEMRGYLREARQWLERLLYLTPGSTPTDSLLRARALSAYANALHGLTDLAQAETYGREALALWRALGDASGAAGSLEMLGEIAMMHEDYEPAVRLLEEARSLAHGAGDENMAAGAVHNLGRIALAREHWSEAWDALSESLRLHRTLGDRNKAAAALNNLGLVARYRGNLTVARGLLHQALSEHHKLGDRHRMAISQLNIGTVNRIDGRHADSRAALAQATTLALEIDDRRVQAWCVKEFGHLACAEDRFEAGVRLLSASESMKSALGISFSPADPDQLNGDTLRAKSKLGDAAFAAIWSVGAALSIAEAIEEVRAGGA